MSVLGVNTEFFALDIGTNGIRVVQLKGGRNKSLYKYASMPLDRKISQSDAPADKQKLAEAVKTIVKQSGISAKNVVVGIPSNKTFVTVVDLPKIGDKEMAKSISYQADQYIPTSAEESKLDWAMLGDSPDDANKAEVLIASVQNAYSEGRLDMLEGLDLNVIAMEPDQFALVRALVPHGYNDAAIILDMGAASTDLVAVYNGTPRLMRSIPTGGEALIKAASQNLSIDEQQATQFVYKFGLVKDKLEGQVFKAVQNVVDGLIGEIDKSIKFFSTRYQGVKINKIVVTGRLATLPEFPLYLVNHTQIPVEIGNSWVNVSYPNSMVNDLASVSHQYSVAVGLAERFE